MLDNVNMPVEKSRDRPLHVQMATKDNKLLFLLPVSSAEAGPKFAVIPSIHGVSTPTQAAKPYRIFYSLSLILPVG
jgi:hypothetical protein